MAQRRISAGRLGDGGAIKRDRKQPKLLLQGLNGLIQIGSLDDVACYRGRAVAQSFRLLDSVIKASTGRQVEASHRSHSYPP
jgi:hypothetical protein